jgi:hypothetical protein
MTMRHSLRRSRIHSRGSSRAWMEFAISLDQLKSPHRSELRLEAVRDEIVLAMVCRAV